MAPQLMPILYLQAWVSTRLDAYRAARGRGDEAFSTVEKVVLTFVGVTLALGAAAIIIAKVNAKSNSLDLNTP